MNKKIRVKPGKPQSALGLFVGIIFVLIGVFTVIPVFGAFGILWTLVALGMAGLNVYHLFSSKGIASHEITIESGSKGSDIEARLALLQEFYDKRVLTKEEYEEQRALIIKDI